MDYYSTFYVYYIISTLLYYLLYVLYSLSVIFENVHIFITLEKLKEAHINWSIDMKDSYRKLWTIHGKFGNLFVLVIGDWYFVEADEIFWFKQKL